MSIITTHHHNNQKIRKIRLIDVKIKLFSILYRLRIIKLNLLIFYNPVF